MVQPIRQEARGFPASCVVCHVIPVAHQTNAAGGGGVVGEWTDRQLIGDTADGRPSPVEYARITAFISRSRRERLSPNNSLLAV